MTTDAKVGLLLGLAFIFIIAFIINGLPSFQENSNNNELTTNMVSWQSKPPVIAAKEREIINRRVSSEPLTRKTVSPSTGNPEVRFATELPKSPPVIKKDVSKKPAAAPKIYVVEEGDSLAIIAKKFYGSLESGKNITRIFDANRRLLKSPDEIYIGQKLIIPPLSASALSKGNIATVLSETELTKTESIGAGHFKNDSDKPKKSELYTVREGDSLWQIACEQLGDGSRCSDIAELNSDILDSEDNLRIGMSLKMPSR